MLRISLTSFVAIEFKTIDGHTRVVIDLEAVECVDSSGIGALVVLLKRMGDKGDFDFFNELELGRAPSRRRGVPFLTAAGGRRLVAADDEVGGLSRAAVRKRRLGGSSPLEEKVQQEDCIVDCPAHVAVCVNVAGGETRGLVGSEEVESQENDGVGDSRHLAVAVAVSTDKAAAAGSLNGDNRAADHRLKHALAEADTRPYRDITSCEGIVVRANPQAARCRRVSLLGEAADIDFPRDP